MESRTSDHTERKSVWRSVTRTVGILAVIAALFPSVGYQGGTVRTDAEREFLTRNPEAKPFRLDYTLGCQSSPLIRRFSEATLYEDGAAGVALRLSNGMTLGLLSWSMAGLAAGILLLWATRTGRVVGDQEWGSTDFETIA